MDEIVVADLSIMMFKAWAKAKKYQSQYERGLKRLKKFGYKRFIFFARFENIRTKIESYEKARSMYVSLALAISRKLNRIRRVERMRKRIYDH